jgi:phytol kinase
LFMLLWPLFSNATGVRYFAAITPFIQVVKLWLAGKGGKEGEEKNLANAISRSGDAEEALGGPFIYVVILLCSTLGFWTNSLVGIMAMSVMSIGDGLADLIGRRFGKNNKWFFAQNKSVAGSLAFVVGSTLGSVSLLSWLSFTNTVTLPVGMLALSARILLICSICAIIELFPFVDDNWSVPIAAAVLTSLLLS